MPDKNLTNNDIVKALENCLKNECDKCSFKDSEICQIDLMKLLFDLINRQKEEIERLKERYSKLKEDTLILQNLLKGMEREKDA